MVIPVASFQGLQFLSAQPQALGQKRAGLPQGGPPARPAPERSSGEVQEASQVSGEALPVVCTLPIVSRAELDFSTVLR
jgi:hypothetical protein